MFYCVKCNNFSVSAEKCPFCGSKKLREAQENDSVYLTTTKHMMDTGMLAEALKQNGIPFLQKEKHGGILKYLGMGMGFEEHRFYVPFGAYEKAKEITAEIFNEMHGAKDTFVYKIKNSLYINLTNRCPCACEFCVRKQGAIEGHNLWLSREPSAGEVIELIKLEENFNEVVFCGFGEPTYRAGDIKKIAAFAKTIGKKTRLDTNGLGNLISTRPTGRDIATYLTDIDTVSVSLNAADEESYNKITNPQFENAYDTMLAFCKNCITLGLRVIMTVVDVISKEEVEKCKEIATELGAEFKVRELIKP